MAHKEERSNLIWAANRILQQVSLTWLTAPSGVNGSADGGGR